MKTVQSYWTITDYFSLAVTGIRTIKDRKADWQSWIIFFLEATIKMAERQFNKLDQAEKLYLEINH